MEFKGTYSPYEFYKPGAMVVHNGDAYVTTSLVAGIQPPSRPWVALVKSSGTPVTSELTAMRQTLTAQNLEIASLKAQIADLQRRVAQAVTGFQTIALGASTIDLSPKGSSITFVSLLSKLLDVPVKIGDLNIMAFRSALGRMLARIAGAETAIADISGSRLPALLTEQLSNASLDAARAAAQELRDSTQEAAAAQTALEAASASSSIAGLSGRVDALEAAPGFDSTALTARVAAAESAITTKAEQAAVDAALLAKANQAEFTVVADRVTAAESAAVLVGGRLDAVESALPSKVAQADYDVFVAAAAASTAAAAAAAATAQAAADAVAATAATKEDKGRLYKMDVALTDTTGVSSVYWAESLGSTAFSVLSVGKVWEYKGDSQPISFFLGDGVYGAADGTLYRFKNSMEAHDLSINFGSGGAPGPAFAAAPGEMLSVAKVGSEWRLL